MSTASASSKSRLGYPKGGRPRGVRDPDFRTRITRRLPAMYDALQRRAEAGDPAAVAMCVDIVRNPDKYPTGGKPRT